MHALIDEREYNERWRSIVAAVFREERGHSGPLCPPEPVFQEGFSFEFVDASGSLASDEEEFQRLIACFEHHGAREFAIVENLGCTQTKRTEPVRVRFSTKIPWAQYEALEKKLFLPDSFKLSINHYFVVGDTGEFGVYVCETPWIHIVGFREVNRDAVTRLLGEDLASRDDVAAFVRSEFRGHDSLAREFGEVYRLEL